MIPPLPPQKRLPPGPAIGQCTCSSIGCCAFKTDTSWMNAASFLSSYEQSLILNTAEVRKLANSAGIYHRCSDSSLQDPLNSSGAHASAAPSQQEVSERKACGEFGAVSMDVSYSYWSTFIHFCLIPPYCMSQHKTHRWR